MPEQPDPTPTTPRDQIVTPVELPPWRDEAPTKAKEPKNAQDDFALDTGVSAAARAAVGMPAPGPARAPEPSSPTLFDPPNANEAITPRALEAAPISSNKNVVVGSDGFGEDATLALAPGDNEASSQRFGALAQAAVGSPAAPAAQAPVQRGFQSAAWQDSSPPSWSPNTPNTPTFVPPAPRQGHGSNPQGPAAQPHTPQSNPHIPVAPQHAMGGAPMMAGQGSMAPVQPQAMPYPPGQYQGSMAPQQAQAQAQAQQQWMAPAQDEGASAQSRQTLVLVIVAAVVCLGIFITGVVLFVTR